MASPFARLIRQGGVYTLGNVALKAGGLVLLLFYLDPALLSQADYGRLVLLETVAQLAVVLAGLGLAQGLLKFGTDPALAGERDALNVTALLASALLGLALWSGLALAARPLAAWLLDDPSRGALIRLTAAYAALKIVASVPYTVMRVTERAGWFVLGLLAEFGLLLGGVYYFLVVRGAGLEGVMTAFALSAGAAAALLSAVLLARTRWRVRGALVRKLLGFGAPLAFANLATVLLNTGDRFVLDAFEGVGAVAVYGLAQKYGGLVNMLFVQGFNTAFAVLGLKALGRLSAAGAEAGAFHRRTFRHFAVLAGWGVLAVSVLALDATVLISPNPAYRAAEPLILPIALGYMGYGVYYIMMNVLYATAQTRRIAANVLGAAGLNLALNLALIPGLGAMGAALSTLAAYAGLAGITGWQARQAVPIAFPWRALGVVLLIVGGLWALAQPSLGWAVPLRLGWRLGLVALYPAVVLAAGVYSREELRLVRSRVRGRLGGREHAERAGRP